MKSINNHLIRREMGITILSNQKLYMNPLHQVELKSNSKNRFFRTGFMEKKHTEGSQKGRNRVMQNDITP